MREIVTYPDSVLRETAQPVEEIDDDLRTLIDDMAEVMYDDDGIGLAANQVGDLRRVIVIDAGEGFAVFINPEIVASGDETESVEEGCLSLPGIRVNVTRPTEVTMKAMNLDGEPVKVEAQGLLARVFQHETDHLNGKMIIDHASPLQRTMMKNKLRRLEKEQA